MIIQLRSGVRGYVSEGAVRVLVRYVCATSLEGSIVVVQPG